MINQRLEKFRERFNELKIDGVLSYKDSNRNYLSGFTGDESFALITMNKAYFITDSRYTEQAKQQVKGFEVLEYKHPIHSFIKKLVEENNIKYLGIEEDTLNYSDAGIYKDLLAGVELVKLNGTIEELRMIKDNEELEIIEKAASIADEAFTHMLGFIKPGMKESEIGIELEFHMRKKGASGVSFQSIVASGVRSALPHGVASDKTVSEGDFLTLDFGCIYKGYCSDMTRTIVIGKASEKQREIYETVLRANEEALKSARPGINCVELDKISRDVIANKGYGDYFGHGLGHGVGMQVHELPGVNPRSKYILKEGMVITDEPGIYIPDFGGVRIEDLLVITENGCKVLSKSPKELIEL